MDNDKIHARIDRNQDDIQQLQICVSEMGIQLTDLVKTVKNGLSTKVSAMHDILIAQNAKNDFKRALFNAGVAVGSMILGIIGTAVTFFTFLK